MAHGRTMESSLCLLLASADKVNDLNMMVVKKIQQSGCTPLVVTVNKPYKILTRTYAKEGISPDSYYVIDAVTKYSGGECVPGPRVRYVSTPSNLTDLGIEITELIRKMPEGKKCIIFDSVSMLMIHSPSVTTSKFLHFLVNKLNLADISGIFLCVEKGLDPVIISQMKAFVDHIVDGDSVETIPCPL